MKTDRMSFKKGESAELPVLMNYAQGQMPAPLKLREIQLRTCMYPLSAIIAALTIDASANGARASSCPLDARILFAFSL